MKNWKRTVLNLLLLCLFALAGASSIRGRRRPFRSIKAPAGQCAICRAVHIHIVRNVSALRANAAARTNVQSCYPTFVPSLTLQNSQQCSSLLYCTASDQCCGGLWTRVIYILEEYTARTTCMWLHCTFCMREMVEKKNAAWRVSVS